MRWSSAHCAGSSIYKIKMFSDGVWNDQMKGLVTSDNPVKVKSSQVAFNENVANAQTYKRMWKKYDKVQYNVTITY